jgi:hypothetical protein
MLTLAKRSGFIAVCRRDGFDIDRLDIRVFGLEVPDQLFHDHELIARQVHDEIGRIGIADGAHDDGAVAVKGPVVGAVAGVAGFGRIQLRG